MVVEDLELNEYGYRDSVGSLIKSVIKLYTVDKVAGELNLLF